MNELRHCGICERKNTYKQFCWACEQREQRMQRAIHKKLDAKKNLRAREENIDGCT
ncbi:hypothetical protein [Lysinibacillus sphaericus]|uniref:hypothetical protein n=1 Tax=Lysinibacillus sphaericus TaxID=1421 RepID=UPI0018CD4CC2|nr:hypothetical protein [Lysinibacillus sphaericus]